MQILGTNTHYQDVKVYQERLDSDHIMDLEELRKVHKEETRKTLNWLNPKADVKIRYKNKKKYYSYISRLSTSHFIQGPTLATRQEITILQMKPTKTL
jgi:hypothetical protein